jgi:CBS domain-containing protein
MRKGRTVLEAKRYGIYSCRQDETLFGAAQTIVSKDISALVVVQDNDSLAGVITRTDLLGACLESEDWMDKPVTDYMSTDVVTVDPHTLLKQVAELLLENKIHRVVVVREVNGRSRPIAVVSDGDFLYHMVKEVG